ncbi:MAG TPA: hypothetical protein VMG81_03450 [Thermoplasmata archaeon]|nr:hypothetical protein [Thermoplasmata archaeon]
MARLSANNNLIETDLAATDLSEVARLLADDAEWVEWFNGAPTGGAGSRGKTAYLQNFDGHNLREVGIQIPTTTMASSLRAPFARPRRREAS